MERSRIRRTITATFATLLLVGGGVALPATTAAALAPFSMSLVGGSFSLGTQGTFALTGGAQCQNGTDDELIPPFGTPDGLIDYPADPGCSSPYDNNESVAGLQPLTPVAFTGTIDGASNFSVSSAFPQVVFGLKVASPTGGVCDSNLLAVKTDTNFVDLAPHTGNLTAGTLTLHLRLDTTLDIECDTDLGPGTNFVPFDFDGAGGMNPWGGATPVVCAHDVSSLNPSASGDTAASSTSKSQAAGVTAPMAGKNLKPALVFGDVFDAVPVPTADSRCGFFDAFVFGTTSADNSALQFAFITADYQYTDLPGIDVNVGDVTVVEGDGGLGALGCGGLSCHNTAQVVVTLSSPAVVDSTVTVIADNTTGGSANGTLTGAEVIAPGPSDYKNTTALRPKVLLFRAGKSTAKFTIPIVPDQTAESTETIMVQVTAVSAGLVANDDVGMVTIVDDDNTVEPDTGISIGDAAVYETGSAAVCGGPLRCKGTAVLPITASSPALLDTPLTYTITNGEDVLGVFSSADAVNGRTLGDDFLPVTIARIKTLRAGRTSLALVVTILADNTSEPGEFGAETLTVTIAGAGVRDGIGNVRILNDD